MFLTCILLSFSGVSTVLNNDSVEFTEEYNLTDVIRSLVSHGWVISRDEQARNLESLCEYDTT